MLVAPLISRDGHRRHRRLEGCHGDGVHAGRSELRRGLAQQATIAIQNARLFEETQREKRYSEGLVLNSPVAIITTDLEAQVVSWNPAAERLFGYTVDEAIGHNLDPLIATDEIHGEAVGLHQESLGSRPGQCCDPAGTQGRTLVDVELLALPVSVDSQYSG